MTNKKKKIMVWGVMLLVSPLPAIILKEFFKIESPFITIFQVTGPLVLLVLSFIKKSISELRKYFIIILAFEPIHFGMTQLTRLLEATLNFSPFVNDLLAIQIPRSIAGFLMIGVLIVIKIRKEEFYFIKGDMDAKVAPVKGLGIKEGTGWKRFGKVYSLFLSLGLIIFMILNGGVPKLQNFIQIVPLVPFILLMACSNAFFEELVYRASIMSTLNKPIGERHSLLITTTLFGIGHYYGVPYGIAGVLLAAFLGYILGKSMQETKGFTWAFIIHVIMDIFIFSFIAMGNITPGGV